jgi:hypothetical protein
MIGLSGEEREGEGMMGWVPFIASSRERTGQTSKKNIS